MYQIKIEAEFSAAHNLRGYKGKCEVLHGHNYKVIASIRGEKLDKQGILIDFVQARKELKEALEDLDHTYLNESPQFKDKNPSAENIAHLIYSRLEKFITSQGLILHSVSVYETDKSCATYYAKS